MAILNDGDSAKKFIVLFYLDDGIHKMVAKIETDILMCCKEHIFVCRDAKNVDWEIRFKTKDDFDASVEQYTRSMCVGLWLILLDGSLSNASLYTFK